MPLKIGVQLGPYEILQLIGAGGQGEVYKAHDTRLNRSVAIKVLPQEISGKAEARARFRREAEMIAALNHPHICTLYDIGHHESTDYLVMELLDGETLATRLQRGPLPLDQAITYGIEAADALDKAHRRGVTHRDLKSSNIMLTKSGVKLLDFGLAKLRESQAPVSEHSAMQTKDAVTAEGTILGTLQYMAPEQLEGKEADSPTDIFALGAVLYEMVTGRKAFEGKTQASLIAAILEREPQPIAALHPVAPPILDRIIRKCLAKDPDRRWQSADDLADELRWLTETTTQATAATAAGPHRSTRRLRNAVLAAAAGFLAALLIAAVYVRSLPVSQPPEIRFEVPAERAVGGATSIAMSPDGQRLAILGTTQGRSQIFIRPLNTASLQPLAGTEGAFGPFWAPDGRQLGFFADGRLKRVDISGGLPQVIAPAPQPRGGTWNADNVIVFSTAGNLSRVSATGGDPIVLKLDSLQGIFAAPYFLPGGKHILCQMGGAPEVSGIYAAALDGSNTSKLLAGGNALPAFAPPNRLLFLRRGTLYGQTFDPARRSLSGDPVRIADQVSGYSSGGAVLAYRTGAAASNAQLTWFDRAGKALGTAGPADANAQSVELSPDGTRVAVHRVDEAGNTDVWLIDLSRNVMNRFTSETAVDNFPLWSPDGTRLIFGSNRSGPMNLYERSVSGAEPERQLFEPPVGLAASSDWSRDGRYLLYRAAGQNAQFDLWAVPLSGDRKPFAWLKTPFDEFNGQFSPDSHWVAYGSDETGRFEIYIQSFPTPGNKLIVSTGGGVEPRWRNDGKEIFYLAPDSTLMAVSIKASPDGKNLVLSAPSPLFQTRAFGGFANGVRIQYAVARDGQRFLVNSTLRTDNNTSPVTVVVNWIAALVK
jgi:eukaryotic-like serine/threonine-protein kinase